MRLGYHSITWGGVTGDATGVTSAKDLVYRVPGSMHRALRDIAAAGYQGVEMFDGNVADFADDPAALRGLLAETGLSLVGVYTGANFVYPDLLPDELHRVRRAAALAATFGAEQLVVGGGARRAAGTPESDYDRLGERSTPSPGSPRSTTCRPATTHTSPQSWKAPTRSRRSCRGPGSGSARTPRTWPRGAAARRR